MNREIRFRAFDKETGLMVKDYAYPVSDGGIGIVEFHRSSPIQCPKWIIMQYTGLKDKNGTPIYEGDIYKTWYSRDRSGDDIVELTEVVELEVNENYGTIGYEILFIENAEVIGNIYESPNLINKQQ